LGLSTLKKEYFKILDELKGKYGDLKEKIEFESEKIADNEVVQKLESKKILKTKIETPKQTTDKKRKISEIKTTSSKLKKVFNPNSVAPIDEIKSKPDKKKKKIANQNTDSETPKFQYNPAPQSTKKKKKKESIFDTENLQETHTPVETKQTIKPNQPKIEKTASVIKKPIQTQQVAKKPSQAKQTMKPTPLIKKTSNRSSKPPKVLKQ